MNHFYAKTSALLLSLALSSSALAEVTIGDYRSYQKDPEKKALINFYVAGVGRGYFWGSVYAKEIKGHGFLCLPPKLILNNDTFTDLLQQELRNPSRKDSPVYKDEDLVEVALLNAMTDTFPCSPD